MLRITVVLFCLTLCFNGLTAKHLVRRSNECQSDATNGFVCPQADGMFPHNECTKFWHCSNCNAYVKDCPANLYWNDEKQECDWPEDVPDSDCQPPSGEATQPAQNSTTSPAQPTTTPAQETTTTQAPSDETTTQESNDETTTQGSNDETTTQGSNEETTPECSGEETTTEGSNDETTTEETSDATTEAQTTTSASTTTEQSDSTPVPSDPSRPSCEGQQIYYPHTECTKYWQCSNGTPYEMTCAPGTAWDQENLTCNWPAVVNCQLLHK